MVSSLSWMLAATRSYSVVRASKGEATSAPREATAHADTHDSLPFFCAHHIIVIFESTTFSPSLSSPDSDPSPLEAELLRLAIGPPPPAPSITPALPTHSSIGAFIAAAS